jgi:predicted CXXCH cytochrome family protein
VKWVRFFFCPALCIPAIAAWPEACAQCHRAETAGFARSAMARALESVAECAILRANPKLTAKIGGYSYSIERVNGASVYTVADGRDTIRVPLQWAFGQGSAGQTYLFERAGQWYESRVSYYSALQGLDLTMGAPNTPPGNLDEAAGRATAPPDAAQCFSCHATHAAVKGELTLQAMQPGIRCERCHGDSERHLTAGAAMRGLGALSTEEISDLCGECHRTWSQIALSGPRGIGNVRFQPYRLGNSRCYDAEDRRIRCTACHNPHAAMRTGPGAYDANCTACHARAASPATRASARICRVATKNCVTCHMPKTELPGAHKKFTDHEIRIVRANERYPD